MHISIRSGIALALLGIPVIAQLQSASELELYLNGWDDSQASLRREEGVLETEELYQSHLSLFPETTSAENNQTELEKLREQRTDDFVSVMIDGSQVIMRDVPRTSWFAPYVRDIAERGIVSGYRDEFNRPTGLFGPQDNVTLEQVAKVMAYASGIDPSECGTVLNVTASGSWSAPFIACAEQKQWAVYGDGSVDVHRNATRAEVIITLLQAFSIEAAERTGTEFADVTLSTQFGSAIEQAKRDGVISGYSDSNGMPNGLFGPEDAVTRAEFAKITTLGLQLYKK